MRSFRHIVLALTASAAVGLSPSAATAQQTAAGWQDAWFWGAYGGYTSFATSIARTSAPTIGVDWMITREHIALNVFAEQAFFNAVSTVTDFPTTVPRRVDIQDMRRVGFAAMIFMPQLYRLKPYFNVGYAFNFIKAGTPEASFFATPAARDTVLGRINDARAEGKLFGGFGLMTVMGRFAPFLQYTVMPTQGSGSWMVNGAGFTNSWSGGLRYNFGTSVDKKW
jgi:hypothetical protein